MENNIEATPATNEFKDYLREREILRDESLKYKESFAGKLKDELGESIREELKKKDNPAPKKEKRNKLKEFLDNIAKLCQ